MELIRNQQQRCRKERVLRTFSKSLRAVPRGSVTPRSSSDWSSTDRMPSWKKKVSPILKFLGYFWGPIPWMIEIAAVLSGAVQHWADFIIIIVLLLFNAVIGFWEEHEAANALDALKEQLALKARVRREGEWQSLPARELVPGDVIRMRAGDIIPADVKLAEGDYLGVNRARSHGGVPAC